MKSITTEEVLATEACFRQRVSLPAAQVAGLADAELAGALAFECEPFSGVRRSDGEIAWKMAEGGDRAVFDVVQIRRADLEAEVAKARRAGRRVRAVTAKPASGETVQDMPWIVVRRGRVSFVAVAAVAAAALLAAAVAWDAASLSSSERSLSRAVGVKRGLQAQKDDLQRRIAGVQREIADLRATRAEEARAGQNVEALRDAWRRMLAAIPGACGDEGVLKEIRATGAYSAKVSGVALSADAAARAFMRLTEALKAPKSGWVVTPGAIGAASSGGTVEFSCSLDFDPQGQFR